MRRFGFTSGDVAMAIAALVVLLALLLPTLRARSFGFEVSAATADVERLSTAARGIRNETGSWPPGQDPGRIPDEVRGAFAGDTGWVRSGYTLQWMTLETVERVEATSPTFSMPADADAVPDSVGPEMVDTVVQVGAVSVHSANDALLASLMTSYGTDVSFVRDTVWTLVIGPPSGS